MLWVYINNTGAAECVVNIGNKVRQGDGFDLFVVLWGMNGEAGNITPEYLQLSSVRYLATPNLEFVQATEGTPSAVTKTFQLNNPTQANYYFTAGRAYNGFLVRVPADATSASVNGGNIALEITLLGNDGFAHAQTITVYVEPTHGAKKTLISETDYSLIIDLIRQANFILSCAMTIATDNGASAIVGDEAAYPTIYLSKSLGFVHGSLSIDRAAITDAYNALPAEEADGFATIAYLSSDNVELKIPATFFGRDEDGNDVQFRLNNGQDGTIFL